LALCFGPFRLVPAERRLERDGTAVPVGSRALDILIALAERPGEVLGRDALMERAWPDLTVDDSNLRFHISGLRKALGEGAGAQRYIVNVPGRGYCLAAAIRTEMRAPPSPPPSPPNGSGLPPHLDRMVGRNDAVDAVVDLVARSRFATILGSGGMGKTTVAIAAAHRLLQSGQDDVRFLDLSPLDDPALVPSALASALGITALSGDPTPEVIGNLRERNVLLVFDGCEHLVDGVASLAETIYLEAPRVSVLATSRERLKVEGERVFILSELEQPPLAEGLTPAEVLGFPAAQLLAERAAAAGHSAELTPSDAAMMAEICRTLDGVPLALELVAGRVADYGWEQTAALLHGRLRLLWTGRRTAPARHQTLTAALDWSCELLTRTHRAVFRRLSVFAEAFSLGDAEEVAAGDDIDPVEVAAAVQALVEKSLLAVSRGDAPRSFRMLDTTRAYARERLAEAGEQTDVARRHARRVTACLASGAPATQLPSLGDVHAALQWCFSDAAEADTAARLAAASSRLFIARSLLNECRRWSARGLALPSEARDPETDVTLSGALGHALMFTDGNGDDARLALEQALGQANDLGDLPGAFRLLNRLHMYHRRCGDISRLLPISRQLEALAVEIGEPVALSAALTQLAVSLHLAGDQPAARTQLEVVLRMDLFGSVTPDHFAFHRHPFIALARCLWLLGYPDQALELARPFAEKGSAPDAVTYSIGLIWGASVFEWAGDWPMLARLADRLGAHARSHSLRPYQAVGLGLQGKVLLQAGQKGGGRRAAAQRDSQPSRRSLRALHGELRGVAGDRARRVGRVRPCRGDHRTGDRAGSRSGREVRPSGAASGARRGRGGPRQARSGGRELRGGDGVRAASGSPFVGAPVSPEPRLPCAGTGG
jgi:predicted ATPase/DNA-binding winged helix-turn-helix (wHTH) protein